MPERGLEPPWELSHLLLRQACIPISPLRLYFFGCHNQQVDCGGERGIRTLGTRESTSVFKTDAFDHSAISPTKTTKVTTSAT